MPCSTAMLDIATYSDSAATYSPWSSKRSLKLCLTESINSRSVGNSNRERAARSSSILVCHCFISRRYSALMM
ncbi:Uncharacterised protein [Vibrio cholerae]|nr:Uncharacterised protein [Vibrio cholerae]